MSNENSPLPKLGFKGFKGTYNGPIEGTDTLPWVGPSSFVVESVDFMKGKNPPHNPSFKIKVRLTDEDCNGSTIMGTKPVAGFDKNGNDLSRNLMDMMVSCGMYTIAQINELIAAMQSGQMEEWNLEEVKSWFIGRSGFCEVGAGSNDDTGKEYSNIDNFITGEMYTEKKKTPGTFRRERPKANLGGRGPTAPIGGATAGTMVKPPALGGIPPPQMGGMGAKPAATLPFTSPAPNGAAPASILTTANMPPPPAPTR